MVEKHPSCNAVLDQVEELAFLDSVHPGDFQSDQKKPQQVPPKSDNSVDLSDYILIWKYLNLSARFRKVFKASCC